MSIYDKTIYICRDGFVSKYDLRTVIQINGCMHPVVQMLCFNSLVGLPIAVCDNNGAMIFGQKEFKNKFYVGHETGHIKLGHLKTMKKGILRNTKSEIEADRYAIDHGFASKEEAAKELKQLRTTLIGKGFWKFFRCIFFNYGIKDLNQRIEALEAL